MSSLNYEPEPQQTLSQVFRLNRSDYYSSIAPFDALDRNNDRISDSAEYNEIIERLADNPEELIRFEVKEMITFASVTHAAFAIIDHDNRTRVEKALRSSSEAIPTEIERAYAAEYFGAHPLASWNGIKEAMDLYDLSLAILFAAKDPEEGQARTIQDVLDDWAS